MSRFGLPLTEKEEEVVYLLAACFTDEEIGIYLDVSPRTGKYYVNQLRTKLDVKNRRDVPLAYMDETGIDPWKRAANLRRELGRL